MDTVLVVTGSLLLLYVAAMAIAYLVFEHGSLLDPIAVSWAGCAIFIAIAMLATGLLYPERSTAEYGPTVCVWSIIGVFFYSLGLFIGGKATRFCSKLPRPAPTMGTQQLWLAWLISVFLFVVPYLAWDFLYEFLGKTAGSTVYGAAISATVLAVVAVLTLKRSPFTKLLMIGVAIIGCYVVMHISFSRRPLAGIAMAAGGLLYHFYIVKKPISIKFGYLAAMLAGLFLVVSYLEATRSYRFYGPKSSSRELDVLGRENLLLSLGGVEITQRMAEFTLHVIPDQHPHLYGSGYVTTFLFFIPRAIWPGKPVSSSHPIAQLYLNTENPTISYGINPMTELYVNFGYIGIPFGMFMIGRAVRVLNTFLRQNSSNVVMWGAWLMCVPSWAGEWRGDFNGMTVGTFLQVSVFLTVVWLSGKVFPGGPSPSPRTVVAYSRPGLRHQGRHGFPRPI